MVESVKPVAIVRYILIIAGLFTTFSNLFDCINQNVMLYEYLFFVVLIFIMTMLLVFIHQNWIVVFVLALIGTISIYDSNSPTFGVIFLAYSARIANTLFYRVALYFVTCLTVLANHTFIGNTPSDTINVLIIYLAILLLDYLLYNVKK
jgi:hypothetical protein